MFAGIFVGALLVGCQNQNEFQAELKSIDSLKVVVENVELKLDSVDSEMMHSRAEEVDRQYAFLEKNFKDSTDRNFWVNKMTFYRQVMKGYTKYVKGEEKLVEEIATSKKQLDALKNSISDGKLQKPDVDQYMKEEAMAVKEMEMHFNKLVPTMDRIHGLYEDLKPQMDSVEQAITVAE